MASGIVGAADAVGGADPRETAIEEVPLLLVEGVAPSTGDSTREPPRSELSAETASPAPAATPIDDAKGFWREGRRDKK